MGAPRLEPAEAEGASARIRDEVQATPVQGGSASGACAEADVWLLTGRLEALARSLGRSQQTTCKGNLWVLWAVNSKSPLCLLFHLNRPGYCEESGIQGAQKSHLFS